MKQHHPKSSRKGVLPAARRGLLCALGFTLLYAVPHGGLRPGSAAAGLLIWGDGLALSGMLVLLLTAALWLDRLGMWDWLLYAFYQARFLFWRERDQSFTNYGDYKRLRERSSWPLWAWLLPGLLWLGGGLALGALYYRAL